MYNLSDIGTVKTILEKHGFTFSKALGQNFLINPEVCPEMARQAVTGENDGVIEIGAGVGVLTAELCKKAKKVVSIELDKRLLPVLDETLGEFDNFEVVNNDILKVDLHKLIREKFSNCENVSVCANLPYYITSPVIMKLLEDKLPVKQIIVMVQREAADRLTAPVGSRESGAITVAVNYYAEAEKLFNVSKGSFVPSPKVDSAVIRLTVYEKPPIETKDEELFFKTVKAMFMQRRKTALNSVSAGLGVSKDTVARALEMTGLDINIRAEKLTLSQLCEFTNNLKEVM
jgi:16S rRNA (adenine1518-N6/adenine1519-N6)-dimethyltransferase